MKVLVTGAKGFIGKNLCAELRNRGYEDIFEVDVDTSVELLEVYAKECDFVFHLAGVNRPKDEREFMEGNFSFTSELLDLLKKYDNKVPILITSSIQAERENAYGISKKAGEDLLFKNEELNGNKALVYRLPNVFGKWSRPNYNTVVATFCHNIARNIEIQVNAPDVELNLVYIDNVVDEFIKQLDNHSQAIVEQSMSNRFYEVPVVHQIKLGELAEMIKGFKGSRDNLSVVDMSDELAKKMYSTYLSFLPEDDFSYELKMNVDHRGSFTEFIRTPDRGQVSVNISKPGITKGNHWHHTKNEKFLVVSGEGVIRFRKPDEDKIIEYKVSGEKLEVVDIPTGYTHSIVNTSKERDMVTLMWVNECFDPERPDTYYLEV